MTAICVNASWMEGLKRLGVRSALVTGLCYITAVFCAYLVSLLTNCTLTTIGMTFVMGKR